MVASGKDITEADMQHLCDNKCAGELGNFFSRPKFTSHSAKSWGLSMLCKLMCRNNLSNIYNECKNEDVF